MCCITGAGWVGFASTKPVRAVPVLISTHGTGTGTDAMGRTRQSDRSGQPDRSRTAPSHRSEARGARQGATQPDGKQGQSALGISCRGNSSPPCTRRSARPPARLPRLPPLDPVLARSLLRRPLHPPSPKPFYYPTLHSLGVIGKGERVETLRPRNQGVTTSPRRPIVLHGSSFNSFLWKRPPGEAPIVLHGNGQGWLTGQTRRPAG